MVFYDIVALYYAKVVAFYYAVVPGQLFVSLVALVSNTQSHTSIDSNRNSTGKCNSNSSSSSNSSRNSSNSNAAAAAAATAAGTAAATASAAATAAATAAGTATAMQQQQQQQQQQQPPVSNRAVCGIHGQLWAEVAVQAAHPDTRGAMAALQAALGLVQASPACRQLPYRSQLESPPTGNELDTSAVALTWAVLQSVKQ
ncbi:MAG: hypothetical protein FRX49_01125 [Trebouxia sp. A1-2]|nr:MAG: hypothetical protein FRX49_01125 [Trebouxia sp. A1-2]